MKNCIYRFLDEDENIIYIGKAKNLKKRLESHNHLSDECYSERAYIDYACFENEYEMDFAERYYIQKSNPKYNSKLADKPISFTSTELDNVKFEIYEINQIVVEKSKYQLEQFKLNELNMNNKIYRDVNIDLFDFMTLSQLLISESFEKICDDKKNNKKFSIKNVIKNYERYKYLKDNVFNTISAIRLEFQKKYKFLDISISFPKASLIPKELIDLESNSFQLYMGVKEKYKESESIYPIIFKCR
ncbi:GIY-YIG nuclease family protein [Paeniclostridium sordellii]|uniref:GIY-YIG nuclease family protein n=1 Tax=Paraclostridium sordellii TaxID=1505 RepID=UPI00214A1533|nr:GIY-YIG nuclease family protein [Paeniclostridium sordellii]MCR1851092.1 GIY-YIG nuclease family protein [Paeniclostridium sordellii]